jgi:polysaccharide export outer membrane protein
MKFTTKTFLLWGFMLAGFSSCRLFQPNFMLRTPADYQFDEIPEKVDTVYRLAVNDVLNFSILGDYGAPMISNGGLGGGFGGGFGVGMNNNINGNGAGMMGIGGGGGFSALVEFDGTCKLPIVGRVPLAGMTNREAEAYLEGLYKQLEIKNPFVQVSVGNRRILLFNGDGAGTQVIPLVLENMNLFEVIAMSGGISPNGKAHRIKVIRGDLKDPQVYLLDISTLEGMKMADLTLQPNDIVYIEPRIRPVETFFAAINPYLTALSFVASSVTTIIVVANLK